MVERWRLIEGPTIGSIPNDAVVAHEAESTVTATVTVVYASWENPAWRAGPNVYHTSLYMIRGGVVRSQTAHAHAALGW